MIIAIDASNIGSHLGGDETLARSMLRGLAVDPLADRVLVLAAVGADLPEEAGDHHRFRVDRIKRATGPVHFGYALPRWLSSLSRRGESPDVVISLTHAPLWSPAPVALTVTDLSFVHVPDAYPRATRLRLQTLVRRQAPAAAAVITISEFCRDDLVATYGLRAEQVHVVPITIEPPEVPDPAARSALAARGVRAPFLLYLGNLHPRKNVARAITEFRAVRAADPALTGHQFVVAGRRWFGSQGEAAAAAGAGLDEVVFLDRVTDAEREVLLTDATALIYLSTFEGFGLPPLEAMARGTVVLAADRTAIPEVCADGALLVDPGQPVDVRNGLYRVLTEEPLRAELRRRGRRRVAEFDVATAGGALASALSAAALSEPRRRSALADGQR